MNAGWVRAAVSAVAVLSLGAEVGAQDSALAGVGAGEPVGVLPFANVSAQVDTAWIGAGIAEAVAADLAERADVVLLERGDADPTDACGTIRGGRPAGLRWVVDGGFQQLGGQLRITARPVPRVRGPGLHHQVQPALPVLTYLAVRPSRKPLHRADS